MVIATKNTNNDLATGNIKGNGKDRIKNKMRIPEIRKNLE